MTRARVGLVAVAALLVGGVLLAQDHAHKKAGGQGGNESVFNQTTQAMASRQVDMGPHMKMSRVRKAQPGDAERADEVAKAASAALDKYRDYKAALADDYQIFLAKFPQKMYHFTNYRYALSRHSCSIRPSLLPCSMRRPGTATS